MSYLKLELNRSDGSQLFARRVRAEQFAPFAHGVTALLTREKVLRPGEICKSRFIPRSDNNPNFGKPVVLALGGRMDDGLGDIGIAFEAELPEGEPLTYVTMCLFATEAQTLYRFDVRLETLLGEAVTAAVQRLLDEDAMADGERFRVVVSAHQKDDGIARNRSRWGRNRKAVPAEVKLESKEPVESMAQQSTVILSSADREEPDIVIGSIEQLVKPRSKSMKSYTDVEAVGQIGEHDIPIFIHRAALERARQSAGFSAKSNEEVGGFFIGSVFLDPEGDRVFVEISETVETDRARGTYVSLEFNYEAWRQVLDRIEGDIRDKNLMGWYHTHLVSSATVAPVEATSHEYVARYSPFFSSHDIFIHRNFFPSPWHVGLVLDLRCKKEVFFAWNSDEIAATQGFYLYAQ